MASEKLTIKQDKFAQGLFTGLSQREAYKQAYDCQNMTDAVIDVKASELAKNGKVVVRIDQLKEELRLRNTVTVERVLAEYAKLGFFDPRNLFNKDGSPKEITELDDETAAALAGLDVQEVYEGFGDDRKFVGYTKKYKLTDKRAALDSIAKHLGMFIEKSESKVKMEAEVTYTGKAPRLLVIEWLESTIDEGIPAADALRQAQEQFKGALTAEQWERLGERYK